jgi:two-component system, NarL family, nitrate/nitrite response regulator NarL
MTPLSTASSSADSPVRIIIADDRPIARDGLRWLIETRSQLSVVGTTGDGSHAVKLALERQADILLVDFPACGRPTLDTLRDIGESGASVRPIVMAERVDNPDLTKALQFGARGMLLDESPTECLFESIGQVMAGRYWIVSDHAANTAAGMRILEAERRRRMAFGVTPRELEVIRAVISGDRNKEIADRFSITENTVKSHLTSIFNKFGVSNRVELALFAAYHRILEGP